MKKILIPAALIAAAILSGAAKKNDPTLMTVNGKPVKVSEFTYLYNKNNQQQAEPQTLDEYVDMFVNYRLKVADAEAAGLDTTAAFKKEYDGYCDDLAKPFLTDSTVVEKLSREQNITVILITHHMDEAICADRVIAMDDGKIIADGAPKDVFTKIDLLQSVGLTAPQTTLLLKALDDDGCALPLDALSVDDCAQALLRQILQAKA